MRLVELWYDKDQDSNINVDIEMDSFNISRSYCRKVKPAIDDELTIAFPYMSSQGC